ncbi:tRNA threonylcarbamoyladenosine dehydratase [Salisediminibacterium halotolerans]|uniref:tRNA A37 threonylcarbamoyladenosine dehydratase n=1 Tax=Salisediminibacterium halotolerans TaxID=517425 RepID=A0A1H9VC72_9BACI|nr:tRNA threonylcarbamoyladenosine dehydratase [Salisediminibacterium haloalkalitolerans]SES18863.1 tRNA A37 threonylcarbamoyladenosine dehydratase [Salisediminibacterium haloalkalitolerans]
MMHAFSRNELAIGKEGLDRLKDQTVAVLGIGGVGSFAAEALARSGVGRLVLVDKDDIDITNVNRQIHALQSTVGESKVAMMKARIADINPECEVVAMHMFYNEETFETFFAESPDFVLDASDTVSYKIHLMKECIARGIPLISSMGAANKMDPTQLEIADISETSYDPLAKIIRSRLRKEGIHTGVDVVYSKEKPIVTREDVRRDIVSEKQEQGAIRKAKLPPSSNAFVPSVAGLIMAGHAVTALLGDIDIERVGN